jgi:uncharacterized membrane protein
MSGSWWRYVPVFAIIVGSLSVAEILFKIGSTDPRLSIHSGHVRALYMAGGMVLMIIQQVLVWVVMRWGLDASVVVPVCGLNFALIAVLGKLWLGESIDLERWVGIVAITLGVALVAHSQGPPK